MYHNMLDNLLVYKIVHLYLLMVMGMAMDGNIFEVIKILKLMILEIMER